MKIVVLDGYTENPGDLSWDSLGELGELTVYDRTLGGEEETIRRIGDAPIVLTNKTVITESVLAACPSVRYIGVLATGYNIVDVEAAKRRGIPVCNIPSYCAESVAQLTFALLLEICHHAGDHSRAVHEGRWTSSVDFCFWDFPLIELLGKTIGIVGYGRIGRAVAKIADAMGMRVLAYSRHAPQDAGPAEIVPLDELLARSDVVSLHCPLNADSQGLIGERALSLMKDGAILLNTARGGLLDEQAVADALKNGKLGFYGADAFGTEPLPQASPLRGLPNALLTPHIAWATNEALQRLMDITANNLRTWLDGAGENIVNA
mgnify:CR=1 FL=1